MSELKKVIAIVGPTASGKTALGVKIAKRFNGEVISFDSMQVYKSMPIVSAAPTVEETDGIAHHLVGILEPTVKYSVADFISKAEVLTEDILSRGKTPVFVGGTGLYIDSFISGVTFSDEENSKVRQSLESMADRVGMGKMLELLRSVDAETASKYHINDRKRIIRALEIYEIHKKTKSEVDLNSKPAGDRYDCTWIGITYRDRDKLYERINRRVDIMLENGLLNEARAAFDLNIGSTAVQAIGHKEFFPYFSGEISLDTAIERLKTETRHYAKRQMTWFKRNLNIHWIYADETPDVFFEAEQFINF